MASRTVSRSSGFVKRTVIVSDTPRTQAGFYTVSVSTRLPGSFTLMSLMSFATSSTPATRSAASCAATRLAHSDGAGQGIVLRHDQPPESHCKPKARSRKGRGASVIPARPGSVPRS